jgi:hypothetical protein
MIERAVRDGATSCTGALDVPRDSIEDDFDVAPNVELAQREVFGQLLA